MQQFVASTAGQRNLLDLNQQQLQTWLLENNQPAYRAQQIKHWLHHQGVAEITAMHNLSKVLRQALQQDFYIKLPQIAQTKVASDGCLKWLLRLDEANVVEMVYIPEVKNHGQQIRSRATLCISSQAGCALDCSFCATGKQGFSRNLSLGEIIGQLWLARQQLQLHFNNLPAISNVVFMGMGEPLLNYEAVVAAANLMIDDNAYGLSRQRVTISTSGVLPAMQKLRDDTPVALALSLHAPNDELRNHLVPINRKYPLAQLMALCKDYFSGAAFTAKDQSHDQHNNLTACKDDQYQKKQPSAGSSKRQVMMEYVMLDGVNDSLQHAKQLINLLQGVRCKVNLIPFNPFPGTEYKASTDQALRAFQLRLIKAGINTRVRRTRADDVAAACGQLAGDITDRTGRRDKWQRNTTDSRVTA